MTKSSRWGSLIIAVVSLMGFVLFSKGFFPGKVIIPGHADFAMEGAFELELGNAQFEKIILIVVDALRSDFMFSNSSSMTFLQELIETGSALPFTAYSNPPTVTLPRLKGITTGQIPSFVDAILNVADDKDNSQGLSNTDSWVGQFLRQSKDRKINFFGDDTWLKLFPPNEFFNQSEGTSLFFVNDFTEVDRNVSRHLERQLKEDFDGLILHYLGVDHIGHTGGPNSLHMPIKLKEMDDVLKMMYESTLDDDDSTLVVIMGDHGMNEVGNHGGSSKGETSPGLALVSRLFQSIEPKQDPIQSELQEDDYEYHALIDQIDLVPTLSALLNFPIPKNNVGIIIPHVLNCWASDKKKKKVLLENCEQLFALCKAQHISELSFYSALIEDLRDLNAHAIEEYWLFLHLLKKNMTRNATNYALTPMYTGLALVTISSMVISLIAFYYLKDIILRQTISSVIYGITLLLYSASLHGSSLIEEEHQFWWFCLVTSLSVWALLGGIKLRFYAVCLICVRLIRSWSPLGQKDRSTQNIAETLLNSQGLLWTLVIIACISVPIRSGRRSMTTIWTKMSLALEVTMATCTLALKVLQSRIDGKLLPFLLECIIPHKMDDLSQLQSLAVSYSRFFYLCVLLVIIINLLCRKQVDFDHSITILHIFLHQSKVEIVPLYLVFGALEGVLSCARRQQGFEVLLWVITFCLQNISFFSIGNSNLIATIDLSNAYNGLQHYDIAVVGLLTFISNFGPALYWCLAWYRLSRKSMVHSDRHSHYQLERSLILLTFYNVSLASLITSCIVQRYHLFIWSVFCPKVLYFAAWYVLVEIGFNIIICQTVGL